MGKEIYWSRFAEDFEARNTYVIGNSDMEIIKDCLAAQKNLGRVLELGCGNGTYSKIIAREADHVWATDLSDEMVSISKARLEQFGNITVEKENCFNLSYEKAYFDTVVMANLLHVIPDPEKALKECRRVLRPGGRMIVLSFTTMGMGFLQKVFMISRYLRTYGKPPGDARHLTPDTARSFLENTGFKVTRSSLIGSRIRAVLATALAE